MQYLKVLNTIISLLSILFFLLITPKVFAASNSFVTIVNPIRGNDFWSYSHNPLDTSIKEYEIISKKNLPATWLVRYDALIDTNVINFLKSLNNQQEVGLFLEITPTLTKAAGVNYHESPNWHYARSILLTGYELEERKKILDTSVSKYKEIFGVMPKSVGSWWIDAFSLNYLHDKYGVEINLDVADQYSTDQYQVWGQYWSTPFYPSKTNALMPAGSPDKKIGVVTIQWATRDPYNAYGNGVGDSTYSVQANDYMLHKLDINYFKKLLQIYPLVTVGLENDFDWPTFGNEYQNQIEVLAQKQSASFSLKTMSGYAAYYKNIYPDISPNVLISSDDPLGTSGKVVWYQTPKYRIGWFSNLQGVKIRDFRIYNDSSKEPCLETKCTSLNLANSFINAVDEINFNNSINLDEGKINNFNIKQIGDRIEISYLNQAGQERIIKFLPDDLEFNDKIHSLSSVILDAWNNPTKVQKIASLPKAVDSTNVYINIFLDFLKFIFLTIFFFLLPGWILTKKIILAIPVGWVIFTLASFLVGYLHFQLGLWLIPPISLGILLKNGFPKGNLPKLNFHNFSLILLILIGSLTWLLTSIKNGLEYSFGLGFWGPNGHDGIWHLALISELQRNFPPQNPVYAGVSLTNYHYFFDLLLAYSGQLLNIDNQNLLFRFFPLVMTFLGGLLMFKVVEKLTQNYRTAFFSTLLFYFSGSFGWIVTILRDKQLEGESMFWAQQAVSTLLNPPLAISLVFILAGLYLYLEYIYQNKVWVWKLLIPLILLWGSVVEFKAYAGVIILGSLGLVTLERLIFSKEKRLFLILVPAILLSILVFLPNNLSSISLFVFSPLWFINSMILFSDRLNWTRLSLALQSDNQIKIIASYTLGLIIFIIGNFGMRILGFFELKQKWEWRILLYILISGLIIPLLFIQKGTNWNTIQFLYYSLFIIDIFAAATLSRIWQRWGSRIGLIIVILVVLFSLPTTISVLKQYIPERAPARLSYGELEALNYLKKQPVGIVLTIPFDQDLKEKYLEPVPLLAYTSTAYVAAFSNHPTFLEDTINLDILGVDYAGRLNEQQDLFKRSDKIKENLIKNNIKYFYIPKIVNFEYDEDRMGIKKIFENEETIIFQVI